MRMTFEVDQKSINDTLRKLSRWDLALRNDLDKEARKVANEIKKDAKSRVHSVSGNLAASIRLKKITDINYTVFPRGEYKRKLKAEDKDEGKEGRKGYHRHLVEYGTIKMRPRPFMRPAAAKAGAGYEARMKKVLDSHDKTI